MKRNPRDVPGFLTVASAGERLSLAPRTVRGLIYDGRLSSIRLGRRHYLRIAEVNAERRRRLGLPLPTLRSARASRASTPPRLSSERRVREHATAALATVPGSGARRRPANLALRRQRAAERAAMRERWLRAGQQPPEPQLPFATLVAADATACAACQRVLRAGARQVLSHAEAGIPSRLCLTCARRAILLWSDERKREAVAARHLAQRLSVGNQLPIAQSAVA